MPKLITAFGETKSISSWHRDPRCTVSMPCLSSRLREGWEAEKAISTPSQSSTANGATHPSAPNYKLYKIWTQPEAEKVTLMTSWRVIPVSDGLRDRLKAKRDQTPVPGTLRTVLSDAVTAHLTPLVEALQALELDGEKSSEANPVRPLRLRVDDSTLATLRYASNQLGIPAQRLLLACLKLATRD